MSASIEVDPDMLRRLECARNNGSSVANALLVALTSDDIPEFIQGKWWTRKTTSHKKTRSITFVHQPLRCMYTMDYNPCSFVRKVFPSHEFSDTEVYGFWDYVTIPVRMSMRVAKTKEEIQELFSGKKMYSDYEPDLHWGNNIREGVYDDTLGEVCGEFFTKILPGRFLVCQSEKGEVMGYATILDGVEFVDNCWADADFTMNLMLSIQGCRTGVYRWFRDWVDTNYKAVGIDVRLNEGSYDVLNHDSQAYKIRDQFRRKLYHIRALLRNDPSYKGGFPNDQVLPGLPFLMMARGSLFLSDMDSADAGVSLCTLQWRGSRIGSYPEHCMCCHRVMRTPDLLCAACRKAQGGEDTIFGTVVATKKVRVRGFGYVPAQFVDSNGKLKDGYPEIIMLTRFRRDMSVLKNK